MGNIATTVEEQIDKLKIRGLLLARDLSKGEDLKRVKENLSDIGYYRLGFYWFPFEKVCSTCKQHKKNYNFYKERNRTCLECNNHRFEDSSNFFDAIDLYYLD
jgi:abortive infection bacteriophage resistance protein